MVFVPPSLSSRAEVRETKGADAHQVGEPARAGQAATKLQGAASPDWRVPYPDEEHRNESALHRFASARRVVEASSAASGSLTNTAKASSVLLDRLVGQRNVVLHGGDTMTAVVASVEYFTTQLQSFVIHAQLLAATAGESLLTGLERERIRLARLRGRLESGIPLESALVESNPSMGGE